jgi:hypothetical protein
MSGLLSEHHRARPQELMAVHKLANRRVRQNPFSRWRAIMRQIKTIIERMPEGFDAQVNAAIQEIGAEHLREIRTMMSIPTEPDRLYGAFIAILIYDLIETGQEEL